MKTIAKISLILGLLYVLFWLGLAVYFNYAERDKGLLEANLSSVFKRTVTIERIQTGWKGMSPIIQISGFKVDGDTNEQPALAFKSISAKLAPASLLRLWPQLTEFAIVQPRLEIVSLPGNKLQIAGITLQSNKSSGINPKRLISWLLNHKSAVWLDGEIVWRKLDGSMNRYSDISFVYKREDELREISAATLTPKGPFAFKAQSNGNILEAEDWDASLEVLGDLGQRLLSKDDLSLVVEDGKGSMQLESLDIQRIKDFLLITGLGEAASWVLDANLSGRLHGVKFDFSGPLLNFTDWSLTALASEVSFDSTYAGPGMRNLSGEVIASNAGGKFEFSAIDTAFDWPRWLDRNVPINLATGEFHWSFKEDGGIKINLVDGFFEDEISKIWDLNASCEIDVKSRNVSNFAQLFKIESVADLGFEQGKVIQNASRQGELLKPLQLDASARFEVKSLAQISRYFPKDPRIKKLHTWWDEAFISGTANRGQIRYKGELSKNAIKVGKAELSGRAFFTDVNLDYGYQRDWPKLLNGKGWATLDNELLTILPDEAWIEEDIVEDASVTISSLFHLDRKLELHAAMETSLPTVMQFLFNGPLLKQQQRKASMPITAESGHVSFDVDVSIPLQKVKDARVSGAATISNGHIVLPQGVPITDVSAQVYFTERSADSDNIRATFLNGVARAKLLTTQATQPPKLMLHANGSGDIDQIKPWLGEHILSWLDGNTTWQSEIAIDGAKAEINVHSNLVGISIDAPVPLAKSADETESFKLTMQVGAENVQQLLDISYGDKLRASFAGDFSATNTFMDSSLIRIGSKISADNLLLKPGVNFLIEEEHLDLDGWLNAIIDLAQLETETEVADTTFLDAMRSINIVTQDPLFLGRQFGALNLSAVSVDGSYWIGSINGENASGTLQAEPRSEVGKYRFSLSRLFIVGAPDSDLPPDPIDNQLEPSSYPHIELNADSFYLSDKSLGSLKVVGTPEGDVWKLSNFELNHEGISTTATGEWINNKTSGSLTVFDIQTTIDEAGDVLDEMDFDGILKKGNGSFEAQLSWIGAPHEFEFARLNGNFDLRIIDGELVKITPGTGKLVGLLNFNAIARRLILDFSDVFSSGLQFDRMQYSGLLADGHAIMRDAYILTPAVFINMEGKLDLDKELIDMELHAAPELAGNLTLLSALANPTAGALVFLTQQIFKDQMRSSNYKSYRALGTWKDFELIEFEYDEADLSNLGPKDGSIQLEQTRSADEIISQ